MSTTNKIFLDSSSNNTALASAGVLTTQGTFNPYSEHYSLLLENNFYSTWNRGGALIGAMRGNSYTFSCWIKPDSLTRCHIVSTEQYNHNGIDWYIENDAEGTDFNLKFKWYTSFEAQIVVATNYVKGNQWNYVTLCIDATTPSNTSIYIGVNGKVDTFTGKNFLYYDSTVASYLTQINSYTETQSCYLHGLHIIKGDVLYTSNFSPPTTAETSTSNSILLTYQDSYIKDNSSHNQPPYYEMYWVASYPWRWNYIEPVSPFIFANSSNGGSVYMQGTTSTGSNITLPAPTNDGFNFAKGDFTIEMWVYCVRSNGGNTTTAIALINTTNIYSQGFTPNSWSLQLGDSEVKYTGYLNFKTNIGGGWREVCYANNSNYTDGEFTFSLKKWNHIALVRNNSYLNLYLNGRRITNATDFPFDYDIPSMDLFLGQGFSGVENFSGYMSDVHIVKGTALYTGDTYTVPTTPKAAVTGTQVLLNGNNADIKDYTERTNYSVIGDIKLNSSAMHLGSSSLDFDGASGLVVSNARNMFISKQDFVNTYTVDMWINCSVPPTFPNASRLFYYYNMSLYIDTTGCLNAIVAQSTYNSSTVITDGTWHHIALVRDFTEARIYIDGNLVIQQSNISAEDSVPNYDLDQSYKYPYIGIGNFNNPTDGNQYIGLINNFRFTRTVRYTGSSFSIL